MTRTVTKYRGTLTIIALTLGLLFLLACSNQAAPGGGESQSPGNQTAPSADLAASSSGRGSPVLQAGFTGASNENAGVWVSGTGEASATPDLAVLNLGVEALGDTVSASRFQAAEAMAATIDALEAQGIASEDVQTRTFNISPRYTSRQVTRCSGEKPDAAASANPEVVVRDAGGQAMPLPDGPVFSPMRPKEGCFTDHEQVLLGFQVTNQLTVKVRDLGNVGDVIDRVTDAGGDLTRFQNIRFTIEDTSSLQDQARESAIKNMMTKAKQVAAVAGVELGSLVYVTETAGPSPTSFNTSRVAFASAESAPTPILSGEMKVSVTVQGAFVIAPAG